MAKKGLHTLIRVRQWEVDEKQRALGVLLREEEAVLAAQAALARALAAEKARLAEAAPREHMTFEAYVRRCRQQREALDAALVLVRRKIDAARDELADAYRRLKTFEITQQQRDAAVEKEENRIAQIVQDDMGIELHRRKAVRGR
jgi:flagellar export protein FliJ